jgi:hypothetical protein
MKQDSTDLGDISRRDAVMSGIGAVSFAALGGATAFHSMSASAQTVAVTADEALHQ